MRRLARLLGRPPDPGPPVPRAGRVRQPPGHRGPHHRRRSVVPGDGLPEAPASGPGVSQRGPRRRRTGPGRAGRDRRLHQAQSLSGHGALLRHHAVLLVDAVVLVHRAPARLRAGLGSTARSPSAAAAALRRAGGVVLRHRRRHGDNRGRSACGRCLGAAGGQAHPDCAARHGRAALESGPLVGGPDRSASWSASTWATSPSGCAGPVGCSWRSWWPRPRWATRSTSPTSPPLLVEVHLLGVTVLVIGAVQCFLGLHLPSGRGRGGHPARLRGRVRGPAGGGRHRNRRPVGSPFHPGSDRFLSPGARPAPIVQRPRTPPFQGGNTGSNPVGGARHSPSGQRYLMGLPLPARPESLSADCPHQVSLRWPTCPGRRQEHDPGRPWHVGSAAQHSVKSVRRGA